MDVIDSELDGRGVVKPFPYPGYFGVVVGMTEDGAYYAVEVLNAPERPIMFIEAGDIGEYLTVTP